MSGLGRPHRERTWGRNDPDSIEAAAAREPARGGGASRRGSFGRRFEPAAAVAAQGPGPAQPPSPPGDEGPPGQSGGERGGPAGRPPGSIGDGIGGGHGERRKAPGGRG